ncbi:glutamate racemase [Tatumella ptyseos]|uniref:glutamate racemase n=1 Tax=Tatumella ptyseos TaxID=82987 RepID=UPI0026F2AE22|nr:aspartate/glutamate racemase family protein [Tatumella ptyseos]WKX25393.1 aspartate/glutamate racemase family protein [Tatumella ptyseos]
MTENTLHFSASPIGVFDAGIGSYAILERLRKKYPKQDFIYLADRRSFPYGEKSYQELLDATLSASQYLISQGCCSLVLASNAPSIVVMDALKEKLTVPIFGIEPPIAKACSLSQSKHIAVLGVNSMVSSHEFSSFIKKSTFEGCTVYGINASSLVELVENFSFIRHKERTQNIVSAFIDRSLQQFPNLDVMTLSSTHLPWLKPFFNHAAPQITFLDPADELVLKVEPLISQGTGSVRCIATDNHHYPLCEFNEALRSLNTGLVADSVAI